MLIADVEPSEVPRLLGAHDAIAVQPALTVGEASQAAPGGEPWEARTVVRFGAAGEGWVFAHCGRGTDAAQERFKSPAAQASRETRAVTVTYEPQGDTATFHLSYAEKGEQRFGVTSRGDSRKTTGVIPAALSPVALLTGRTDTESLRGALDSIASYFGVTVSQEAVCHGRLDGVETRSWLREPAPGEGWAYWTRT